jgi:hypothetical protein
MNDSENRKLHMFQRSHQFFSARAADFAAGSLASQLTAELATVIADLESQAAAEASSGGAARQGSASRAEARETLRDDLEAIYRTVRTFDDEPGLHEKFRVPRGRNDQQLLNSARAFAADALPLKANFIAHELPASFIEDLNDDIADFERAMADQSDGVGARVASAAAIDEAVERGTQIIRKLHAIVKNKYRHSPAALAEWTSASHTERAPRARGGAVNPPTAPPDHPPAP